MKRSIIPLFVAGVTASCGGEAPMSVEPLDPDYAVAGAPGCFAVSGALDQMGRPGGLAGVISGDIEGEVVTVGGIPDARGVVISQLGEQTWEITGGAVEPLIDTTVHFAVDVLAVFARPPVFHINTTSRVVEGAQQGNLTYHGWTDVSTVPITSRVRYEGVICP